MYIFRSIKKVQSCQDLHTSELQNSTKVTFKDYFFLFQTTQNKFLNSISVSCFYVFNIWETNLKQTKTSFKNKTSLAGSLTLYWSLLVLDIWWNVIFNADYTVNKERDSHRVYPKQLSVGLSCKWDHQQYFRVDLCPIFGTSYFFSIAFLKTNK